MVVSQSNRTPGRSAALLALALLIVPAAFQPTAAQPDPVSEANWLLKVRQGEAHVAKVAGGERAWFLDNATSAVVQTRVYNYGNRSVSEVPVYFWFSDADKNPNFERLEAKCVEVDVPAGRLDTDGRRFLPGVSDLVVFPFAVPVDSTPGGYNVTVLVNQAPPAPPNGPPMEKFGNGCSFPSGRHGDLTSAGAFIDPPGDHHKAVAYFVKEKRLDLQVDVTKGVNGVRWCSGAPETPDCIEDFNVSTYPGFYDRTVHTMRPDPNDTNFEDGFALVPNPNDQPTTLWVNVKNVGGWHDTVDWGGPCRCVSDGFPYYVRVTAAGFGGSGERNVTWSEQHAHGVGWQKVGIFPLRGAASTYRINVTLDPAGKLPEGPAADAETNNKGTREIHVRYVDFSARINATEFRTVASNPYPYTTEFPIRGNVTFRNLGDAPVMHPEGRRNGSLAQGLNATLYYRVYIPGTNFSITRISNETLGEERLNFTHDRIDLPWVGSNVAGTTNYIRPGKHKIVAEIDHQDYSLEFSETNNKHEIEIYVEDSNAPTVPALPQAGAVDDPAVTYTSVRPAQPFAVRARVNDDDLSSVDVKVNFTLNATVWRTYRMTRDASTGDSFSATIRNLTFVGEGSTQTWTYFLEVKDSFNNTVNTRTQAKTLRLDRWPIHLLKEDDIIVQQDDNATFDYASSDPISYIVKVLGNWTGVPNQANVTHNLLMYIDPAGSTRLNQTDGWLNLTYCRDPVGSPGQVGNLTNSTVVCNPTDEWFSHFKNTVSRSSGKPGRWNVSIGILDVAGDTRWINRTLHLRDKPPAAVGVSLLNATWGNATSANHNQTVWITANFSDDRSEPMRAYANFTRSDGKWQNFTLTPRGVMQVPAENDTTTPHHLFNDSFATGLGHALGMGGDLNVTVSAVDGTDNWIVLAPFRFTLNDTAYPRLHDAKATPSVQEVGHNVTFTAYGWDETNMTMRVVVMSGGTVVLDRQTGPLPESPNKFSLAANFTVEGNYAWTVSLIDSMGRAAERTGTLSVRENLGPRFEILSPAVAVGSERYGQAAPRIELLAYDSDDVDTSSLVLVVDGRPVVPEISDAPPGRNGVVLSHQVPAGRKFAHGDVVAVNVSGFDGSDKRLEGWLNFTFKVDDVAPSTRFTSFEPRHRERDGQVWNVSLATRFALAAEDEDGLPTGVASIRYRILAGGANSGENEYTTPFRIHDAPGVYRGPTLYYVHAWAEDEVGNVNKSPVIATVWVDEAPPELVQFFPQGRHVNATFVDDRVGVQRAVVWHRVNAEPYRPLELEADAGNLWKGVLPEARKGDRVCYYLQAWDNLNNTQTFGNASEAKACFSATNQRPTVRITSPVTGSRVANTFDLTWTAEDKDGDALVFTISQRPPGRTGYVELAKLDNSETRRYPIDTRRFQDGEYVFRVQANDGGVVEESTVSVRIVNRADPIVGVSPVDEEVVVGGTVLLKAQIAKAEALVEARLYREGEPAGTFAMNDEGRDGDEVANDGYYSVRAPVEAGGDYRVEIVARYEEDGEVKSSTMRDAVSFSAKLTPEYVLKEYAVLLVLIAVAAVVAVGLAAWFLAKRR